VVPYCTCELDGWSVVHVIVADVAVTPLEVTALMTGIDTVPDAERSSSAAAAHGAGLEAAEHVTEPAAAAVLSQRNIST